MGMGTLASGLSFARPRGAIRMSVPSGLYFAGAWWAVLHDQLLVLLTDREEEARGA